MAERPMNGWAQTAPRKGAPWHQVDYDTRTRGNEDPPDHRCRNEATLCCTGQVVVVDPSRVMDYRWHPRLQGDRACRRDACQRPVEP